MKEKREFLENLPTPASELAVPPRLDELLEHLRSTEWTSKCSVDLYDNELTLLVQGVLSSINIITVS